MRSFQLEKETGEKVRKGCEVGSAQDISGFPCSLSATCLILPASSLFRLCFPWNTGSSEDAESILQDACCFPCISFCFHQLWVWMTFVDPVRVKLIKLQRLAWVLLTHPSPPGQEMETKPSNHTCPAYEVPVSWLRPGVWLCVSVAEAVAIHSQTSLLKLLHSPATSPGRKIFLRRQLSYWSAVLLCSFLSLV